MNTPRFSEIFSRFSQLRVAVLGDVCLDRYLEIDPNLDETSIETGLTVFNVCNVRNQPGAAGTIINNLAAMGVAKIFPVGFCGIDGEGMELQRALEKISPVDLRCFLATESRRTFTYTKPLVVAKDSIPRELNRLDFKNWTPTPSEVWRTLITRLREILNDIDALIVLDQVDVPNTGVIVEEVLQEIPRLARARPGLVILADSRSRIHNFTSCMLKMNRSELARIHGQNQLSPDQCEGHALALAKKTSNNVFITLSEDGILAASPQGDLSRIATFPLRGPIDVVGAGDAVTAALAVSLAVQATPEEALRIANAAASVVVHKLGTTGTASVEEMMSLLEK